MAQFALVLPGGELVVSERSPRTRHPRFGDQGARSGRRAVHRGHLPASARRL